MTDATDNATPRQGLTRRQFIKSVIAAGAVSAAGHLIPGLALAGGKAGPAGVERLLTLSVNGQKRPVDVLPQETLAQTLRNKLGLTGLKIGCDRAECGACTVLVDGVPQYSCSVLTHSVRDKKIVTIEGLAAPDGRLHPLQQGVLDEQGFQCGYCAPGFLMATLGYLQTHPDPSREELARGVSGNLCRCQDYDKILTGLLRGAEYMRRG
ncbi:Carbon-monoxide dehydrogenase (acceptor) [Solidesulfovibrio carbinoliphilus subsp. oakridgensis]|uniref:Carbon-monoxide dehydrogenase (Acceptor) n=1 Tax=Solidesulfovibrio carbinoliphilus subsp. oakridgensis TaxID=694327 RepID=G7QC06_9BACT|nr:(2Fe-2S)-binding protein [Solidesulfovibrio carbinoliphilus]EHJ46041.1 Carbon-monoxide dehydrogenase (acceptor) [Solidesulfovibrio carbinoliphilus subsp. oakridgensis]